MEYLTYIIIAVIAFWAGWRVGMWISAVSMQKIFHDLGIPDDRIEKLMDQYVEDRNEQPRDEDGLNTIEVRIEQHQGQLYAFRVDNDEFLGQGTDRDSLIQRLAEGMTDVRLIISEDNGAQLLSKEA